MDSKFARFLAAYPPEANSPRPVDAPSLAAHVRRQFGMAVPKALTEFWSSVGSGYFGDRELYFFGDGAAAGPRDPLIAWNRMDVWDDIFPDKAERPLLFAETFCGDQLGFRHVGRQCWVELLAIDTFQIFIITEDFDELFTAILIERSALAEEEAYKNMRRHLGPLPDGVHYAPILSPLAGGTTDPDNHHFETPNVHVRTSLATYQALARATKKRGR